MAESSPISDDVRRFVLACIPSVPYLEAALLFMRGPDVRYSIAQVGSALYIPERQARELVEALCNAGVVSPVDHAFVYAPRDETMARAFESLAAAYFSNLVDITKLIHSGSGQNAARFAEAFKLKKER